MSIKKIFQTVTDLIERETLVGARIVTRDGDEATVIAVKYYPRGLRRLIVRWDDSPSVVQGSISYHSKHGNSVWAHGVTVKAAP